MANTTKIYENEIDVVYTLNSDLYGMFSVPKDLDNNIRVFMMFGNNPQNENDRNSVVERILKISKNINSNNNDGLCIVAFLDNNILANNDSILYEKSVAKIKNLVNEIYNKLLAQGNYTKSNFIKKVELLYEDNKYLDFINYLCAHNPEKFHANSYQEIMNNNSLGENIYTNNLNSSLTGDNLISQAGYSTPVSFGVNNNQSTVQPVSETLSIGSYIPYYDDTSGSGGPSNSVDKNKVLVKKLPKSAAFIKISTVLLILVLSLVIGIGFSIYLLR